MSQPGTLKTENAPCFLRFALAHTTQDERATLANDDEHEIAREADEVPYAKGDPHFGDGGAQDGALAGTGDLETDRILSDRQPTLAGSSGEEISHKFILSAREIL